jgi:hypothetical protein
MAAGRATLLKEARFFHLCPGKQGSGSGHKKAQLNWAEKAM